MIVLTLVEENEELFINPWKIIAVLVNGDGVTEVMCESVLFEVKETPLQVFNLINNKVN